MPVAFLHRQFGCPRPIAVLISGTTCWVIGLGSAFSFNLWANWFPLAALPAFVKATLFDLLDHLTSNVLLPLGGLALALFSGWAVPTQRLASELHLTPVAAKSLEILMRYITPVGIAVTALAPLVT
jgi:NSS family neurotransmitter:Na+ symporter